MIAADFVHEFPELRPSDVNFFLILYDKFGPNASEKHKIEGMVGTNNISIKEGFFKPQHSNMFL